MKLRISGNSVRFRLTRPEVERFAADGRIEQSTSFGVGGPLTYCLERISGDAVLTTFAQGTVTVRIPHETADTWASGEDVGIAAAQTLADGSELQILIEKDFACLKPRAGEDTGDHYPHPASGAAC